MSTKIFATDMRSDSNVSRSHDSMQLSSGIVYGCPAEHVHFSRKDNAKRLKLMNLSHYATGFDNFEREMLGASFPAMMWVYARETFAFDMQQRVAYDQIQSFKSRLPALNSHLKRIARVLESEHKVQLIPERAKVYATMLATLGNTRILVKTSPGQKSLDISGANLFATLPEKDISKARKIVAQARICLEQKSSVRAVRRQAVDDQRTASSSPEIPLSSLSGHSRTDAFRFAQGARASKHNLAVEAKKSPWLLGKPKNMATVYSAAQAGGDCAVVPQLLAHIVPNAMSTDSGLFEKQVMAWALQLAKVDVQRIAQMPFDYADIINELKYQRAEEAAYLRAVDALLSQNLDFHKYRERLESLKVEREEVLAKVEISVRRIDDARCKLLAVSARIGSRKV